MAYFHRHTISQVLYYTKRSSFTTVIITYFDSKIFVNIIIGVIMKNLSTSNFQVVYKIYTYILYTRIVQFIFYTSYFDKLLYICNIIYRHTQMRRNIIHLFFQTSAV